MKSAARWVERADQGMGFQEIERRHVGGLGEQVLEVAQPPGAVVRGDLRSLFQRGDGVFLGPVQQAEHDAQPRWTAGLARDLGLGAGQRTDQPALVQQMGDAALDDMALAAVQVYRIGGEFARFSRVQGDLLPLQAVNPHQPGFVSHPVWAANLFGRHGIVRTLEFDMAATVDLARGLLEARKNHRRQRAQHGLLNLGQERTHLLARGAWMRVNGVPWPLP